MQNLCFYAELGKAWRMTDSKFNEPELPVRLLASTWQLRHPISFQGKTILEEEIFTANTRLNLPNPKPETLYKGDGRWIRYVHAPCHAMHWLAAWVPSRGRFSKIRE